VVNLDGHFVTDGKSSTGFGLSFIPRSYFSARFEFGAVQGKEFQPRMNTNGRESFLIFRLFLILAANREFSCSFAAEILPLKCYK
jgi:hypothetical protein